MAIGKISDFKSALTLGGARPSLFDVKINGPVATVPNIEALAKSQYQCNTTSIPGLTVTPMEKQYFGRTVKLPGEMTFGTLSTTFINPEDYGIRKAMEAWMEYINGTENNLAGSVLPADWYGEITIRQYTKNGDVAIDFDFIDCWPSSFDAMELSYDTTGAMEEFSVTWEYNYYTSTAQDTSTALGNQE
jgi:hypothetical protein